MYYRKSYYLNNYSLLKKVNRKPENTFVRYPSNEDHTSHKIRQEIISLTSSCAQYNLKTEKLKKLLF